MDKKNALCPALLFPFFFLYDVTLLTKPAWSGCPTHQELVQSPVETNVCNEFTVPQCVVQN